MPRDLGMLDTLRAGEQAVVGADQVVAQAASVLKECKLVRTRIRAVQNAKSVDAARRSDERPIGQVDQQPLADEALHLFLVRHLVLQPAPRVEVAVLQHQRDLGLAEREIEAAPQRILFFVVDEQQTRQPVVGLLRDESMRVRVILVHRGTILQLEVVLVGLTGFDDEPVAVTACVVVQAVPVSDRRLVELVRPEVSKGRAKASIPQPERVSHDGSVSV